MANPADTPDEVEIAEALPLIQGLEQLHEAVALIDGSGRVAWMSEALAALCAGDGEVQGRAWVELLVAPRARELARRVARGERLLNEPITLRGHDSTEIPATLSAAPLGGDGSGSQASVAIVRLEPGSERVGREFRHTVEYLSAILDSSPDGVIVVDRSRFITYANPAMVGIMGWEQAEMLEKPLALFLHSQEDLESLAAALESESPVQHEELEVRRRDGSTLKVSVSASLLLLPDGTEVGAVAHVRDESGRHQPHEDLVRKNADLEHYVDAVSHDLRSPLVSLLGFSRLLREDYGVSLDDKGRHFLRRIEEAGRTMEGLIHDLLELSRIGRAPQAQEWVNPREVLIQLQAELKPRFDSQHVRLDIPEDPPLVRCDRTRLYQVFSNLLGNALDHMGDVPEPAVRVEIRNGGANHQISVRDNGRGIDPTHHQQIFEVFKSLSPDANGRTGTGVGLAIVKKIAETQGGEAWVESEPGRGACFHVSLPSR